jgi:hypothetical protein
MTLAPGLIRARTYGLNASPWEISLVQGTASGAAPTFRLYRFIQQHIKSCAWRNRWHRQ